MEVEPWNLHFEQIMSRNVERGGGVEIQGDELDVDIQEIINLMLD